MKNVKMIKNEEVREKKSLEQDQKEYFEEALKFFKRSCGVVIDGVVDIIRKADEGKDKDED